MNLNSNDMNKMIKTSTSSFEDMRKKDTLYVDKTEYLYKLIIQEGEYFFLSRPRRFGKSLTISTLEAIFSGKKELFDGLAISKTDYEFTKYPVVRIDFGSCQRKNASLISDWINDKIFGIAKAYGVSIENKYYDINFENLLKELYDKFGKVVVLIDEYDKPLSDSVDNIQNALEIRDVLRSFFEVLKASAKYLRFVFITGVTKFSKVSVFSSMNNLKDLSVNKHYATMLGYTEDELENYFAEGIDEGCKALNLSKEEYLDKIKHSYDGYRFAPNSETVYNPVSVGRFFEDGGNDFKPYWVDTGGQKLLYEVAKKVNFNIQEDIAKNFDLSRLSGQDIVELTGSEVSKMSYNSLLLQSGYLTIKSADSDGVVSLDFPNEEVSLAYSRILLPLYTNASGDTATNKELLNSLKNGDIDKFIDDIKAIFASIPNIILGSYEYSFQTGFYCMLKALGARIEAEVPTNKGRIDAVVETDKHIYIFEFKINQSATKAIAQIREKGYAERYLGQVDKQIHLVGISFSSRKRTIGQIKIENL